jgi:predicted nucleic acid-binding protein
VKVYVDEMGSEQVMARVTALGEVATSVVAYAEARAAFARHFREKRFDKSQLRSVVRNLDDDWSKYTVMDVVESVARRAGALAERFALRGFDAIHLATALQLRTEGLRVEFACFDDRLLGAAKRARLRLLAP